MKTKIIALHPTTKKAAFKLANGIVLLAIFTFFIMLSINNSSLFLPEIIISSCIVIFLCLLNLMSRNN